MQSRRSKRCATCQHILIKPEQKSASTRYKIKLVASNYLPSIDLHKRPPAALSRINPATSSSSAATVKRPAPARTGYNNIDDEPLRPGRTYTYELTFTNPLYEAIQVRLAIARPLGLSAGPDLPAVAPYAVNLPSAHFPVSAFAEAWEYEEDAEAFDRDDDAEMGVDEVSSPSKFARGRGLPGVVARKANTTTVLLEVAVSKESLGPIEVSRGHSGLLTFGAVLTSCSSQANMLVTYIYQSDQVLELSSVSPSKSPSKASSKEDVKSFSFWTLFKLGTVQPRASKVTNANPSISQ